MFVAASKTASGGWPGVAVLAVLAAVGSGQGDAPAADAKAAAQEILARAGVKGGLIVHVGCGDGSLTAALRANDSFLVHGLDADAAKVRAAREHAVSLGLYGKVSIERWAPPRLPLRRPAVQRPAVRHAASVLLLPGGQDHRL